MRLAGMSVPPVLCQPPTDFRYPIFLRELRPMSDFKAWTDLEPRCGDRGADGGRFSIHIWGGGTAEDVVEISFLLAHGKEEARLVGYYIRPDAPRAIGYPVIAANASAVDLDETGSFWVELPADALLALEPYSHHAVVRSRSGAEYNTRSIDSDRWPALLRCPAAAPAAAAANASAAASEATASAGGAGNDSPDTMVESSGTAAGHRTVTGVGGVFLALLVGGLLAAMAALSVALLARKFNRYRSGGGGTSSGGGGPFSGGARRYQITDAYDREEDEFALHYNETSPKSVRGGSFGGGIHGSRSIESSPPNCGGGGFGGGH
ncbi:unnamed protein product, partial [Phaeothamnion confervicola]